MLGNRGLRLLAAALLLFALSLACGETSTSPDTDVADVAETDAAPDADLAEPVPDAEAAARAFRLYYRERVERAVIAYNRTMLFGDLGFGLTIGKAGVARDGDQFEVVAGPNDNNPIGVSLFNVWHAWKIFGTRALAMSLLRMFDGLAFMEAISGHPGLTARCAMPGWTRTVDGVDGVIGRLRDGQPVSAPTAIAPELEAELLATFYDGVRYTYREDPSDFLLSYMPANEVGPFAVTYGFSMLPDYLRVSDCCTSLMRTPEGYAWEGAFWSNHNSRDNFPDLGIGLVIAREAARDDGLAEEARAAAERAVAAGQRIGDHVLAHDGRLMTVDEHNPYDSLIVAGAVRPDGETESEDLGSLSDCQMAFLARAVSSEGLTLPLPELPAPGSIEQLLVDALGDKAGCVVPAGIRTCTRLEEAYCGKDWGTLEELELGGKPWLELVEQMEENSPGAAEMLIGGFQDDFYEKNIAMLALVNHARVEGDAELLAATREALGNMTALMRRYAELIYANTAPARYAERVYEAALFDAQGGLTVDPAELGDFARAEAQIARLEALLTMADTEPAPLLSDEEILERVEAHLAGRSDSVKARYRAAYGDQPPLRRAGEGYEARVHHPDDPDPAWRPVERPHHRVVGGVRLLEALPLCDTAPHLLDCAWARWGCERPDLDGSGAVDADDQILFASASEAHAAAGCHAGNGWCGGADLDRTGAVDALDEAFMAAAQGCWYALANPNGP